MDSRSISFLTTDLLGPAGLDSEAVASAGLDSPVRRSASAPAFSLIRTSVVLVSAVVWALMVGGPVPAYAADDDPALRVTDAQGWVPETAAGLSAHVESRRGRLAVPRPEVAKEAGTKGASKGRRAESSRTQKGRRARRRQYGFPGRAVS